MNNAQGYSRNNAGFTSPNSNRYGNQNYLGNRTQGLGQGINRTKSLRAVDTPGRGLGRTSARNTQGNYNQGVMSGRYNARQNNNMFKSNVHGAGTGDALRYHSPNRGNNMNKSHTFFGRNNANQNGMKKSFVGGNNRTNNMNKSFAFTNRRNERNTTYAGGRTANFKELANMKRSHGPMGMRPANSSAFRAGRASSMAGNKARNFTTGKKLQNKVKKKLKLFLEIDYQELKSKIQIDEKCEKDSSIKTSNQSSDCEKNQTSGSTTTTTTKQGNDVWKLNSNRTT